MQKCSQCHKCYKQKIWYKITNRTYAILICMYDIAHECVCYMANLNEIWIKHKKIKNNVIYF